MLFVGKRLNSAVNWLREFNIPEPVSSGLLVCLGTLLLYLVTGIELSFDLAARDALLVYFFAGIAMIAKGLIGIVFPFAIVGFYFVLSLSIPPKQLLISAVWGILVTAAAASLWYVPVYLANGWEFIGFRTSQNIRVAPTASPGEFKTGYVLKLNGSAIYQSGQSITVDFKPKTN